MPRGSQFDEKRDFIAERYEAGASIKEILGELGADWYSYDSLYTYIRNHFGKREWNGSKCEKCKSLVLMDSPNKSCKIPVCVARNMVFRRDKVGFPRACDVFSERSD